MTKIQIFGDTDIEESLEDHLRYHDDVKEGDTIEIYKGEVIPKKASNYADITSFYDSFSEMAYANHDDIAEGWPSSEKENFDLFEERLRKLVDEYFDEIHDHPQFGSVENVKELRFKVISRSVSVLSIITVVYKSLDDGLVYTIEN